MAKWMRESERHRVGTQRSSTGDFGFLVLANSYRRIMDLGKARQICLEGLEHQPNYLSARMALAVILFEIGESEKAQVELEAVIEAAPSNVLARRLLGSVYKEAGSLEKAKKQFEDLLWLFPGHEEALKSFAELEREIALAESEEASSTEVREEVNVDEESAVPTLLPEDKLRIGSPKKPFSEEMLFPEFMDIDESEPPYTRTLSELHEEQKHVKKTRGEEENNFSADLLLFDYEQENTVAGEEEFLKEKGEAEEGRNVASINLDFPDLKAEKEEKELLPEEEPAKTGEFSFGNQLEPMAEVEDIGLDLGVDPNVEPNPSFINPLDDPDSGQGPGPKGVEESPTSLEEDGRNELAPDKVKFEEEGAIERLENLLQKIRAKREG